MALLTFFDIIGIYGNADLGRWPYHVYIAHFLLPIGSAAQFPSGHGTCCKEAQNEVTSSKFDTRQNRQVAMDIYIFIYT